jgi:hypothetical protein
LTVFPLHLFRLADEWVSEGMENDTVYETSEKYVSAEWHYNDTESGVVKAWCAVGTYPYAEDISAKKELNISSLMSNGINVASINSTKSGNLALLP